MTLRLHDSKTRTVSDFTPLKDGEVSLYVCGPTVQDGPHVGHIRTFLAFDVLVRWLRRSGYRVTYVRNVTDIDDKILARAAEEGEPWWKWSYANERKFGEIMDRLGAVRPDYEPRATGHVTEMIDFMQRLIERGHAYADGEGSVYFDVSSLPEYGSLTNQSIENMVDDAEAASNLKQDPRDFALWKKAKDGEPTTAKWSTPFGEGRPGWHLECSAMAKKYVGESFDIHGGGLDLRFPHHENEQAQSYGAGYGFAQHWMHSGMLTVDGMKMGKSLGNFITAEDVLAKHSAAAVRLAIVGSHYRTNVEFNETTLAEAETVLSRLEGTLTRALEAVSQQGASEALREVGESELPARFVDAMNDDLSVAEALAVIHERQGELNSLLAEHTSDAHEIARRVGELRDMLDVLGLDLAGPQWADESSATNAEHDALDALIRAQLEERAEARANKDWASADAIRDRFAAAGIRIEDSAGSSRWSLTN
ncbi:cysteine--tRNA ligase [Dermabacter sp. HMSC06F07]|uniref:cysteine--tRNA ligase n=1 Tax=Dermabacter TaxID=36739 RepID=UPI000353D3E0|nr:MULTISPECIES: cysteine--tRNA ligase [Dermabacter]EPH15770.1 cysteine-tRNA ligase [Dermabacter sp. HFH0086]MCT1708523.1 cysteine--tRNA ligase [Dermabacter hominis]OFT48509.1 cysteine--tRNA ligase [Dermabacter sp. HMSC06F07]